MQPGRVSLGSGVRLATVNTVLGLIRTGHRDFHIDFFGLRRTTHGLIQRGCQRF